jgi:hypothetical protein
MIDGYDIGRVVVSGQPGDRSIANKMLLEILQNSWPEHLHLKFLITPGGFVISPFPSSWSGCCGWKSSHNDFDKLILYAEQAFFQTVTSQILKAAEGKIDIITVGIDLIGINRPEHAEFIAVL